MGGTGRLSKVFDIPGQKNTQKNCECQREREREREKEKSFLFRYSFSEGTRSVEMRTQKSKSRLVRTQSLNVLPLKS